MNGNRFTGVVVTWVNMKAWDFTGKEPQEIPIPDDLADTVESIRTRLIEAAAETKAKNF